MANPENDKVKVIVQYFAPFTSITRVESEEIKLNEARLENLLSYLVDKYPPLKNLFFDTQGNFHKNVIICINGKFIKDKDIAISNGDEIAFLLALGGG
jgi:MoaD family protein